jgi:hypothetical protein
MIDRGIGMVKLSNGNKLLLVGRPDTCWLVVDCNFELVGEFNPKTHGAGNEYLGSTSLAKLAADGISVSGVLGLAIMEKMVIADNTVYLESRAGKRVG